MSSIYVLCTLSGLLGLTSFAVGILPLSFTFSSAHMSRLSSLGTGLLLGAALGIIIPDLTLPPEESKPSHTASRPPLWRELQLPCPFSLALRSCSSWNSSARPMPTTITHTAWAITLVLLRATLIFDVELAEEDDILHHRRASSTSMTNTETDSPLPAYPITIGLVVHGLADGLALGMSVLSDDDSSSSRSLSLVVFLALAVHKVGAVASYATFYFFGSKKVDGVGTALLVSAGSFLYVATVLQPVSRDHSSTDGVGTKTRIFLLVLGIFTPFLLSNLLGHGDSHGAVVVPP
ncbi:hypothetical protein EDB83DRAFT_2548174 [Lactarius deliciosus]|nr:hypothetical protein EDB83DRAFT_2548174 [Lactarius deliciosus]